MRTGIDEPISPELVLVDPELAARVRPFAVAGPTIAVAPPPAPTTRPKPVPPPPAPLRAPSTQAPESAAVPAHVQREPVRASRRRGMVHALTLSGALLLLGLAFLPPRNAPSLSSETPRERPTPARAAPPPPTVAVSPQRLARKRPVPVAQRPPARKIPPRAAQRPSVRSTPRPPAGKVPEKPGPPRRTPLLRLTWPARSGAAYFLVEVYRHGRLVHATSVHTRTFVVPSWLPAGRYEWRVLAGVASPASRKTSGVVDHGWFIVS